MPPPKEIFENKMLFWYTFTVNLLCKLYFTIKLYNTVTMANLICKTSHTLTNNVKLTHSYNWHHTVTLAQRVFRHIYT